MTTIGRLEAIHLWLKNHRRLSWRPRWETDKARAEFMNSLIAWYGNIHKEGLKGGSLGICLFLLGLAWLAADPSESISDDWRSCVHRLDQALVSSTPTPPHPMPFGLGPEPEQPASA
jgi:hypothetical protein